jgi:hypothetical protein
MEKNFNLEVINMEKRKFMRFPVDLKIEAQKQDQGHVAGIIKDFSREGLRVVFDEFSFELNSPIKLAIQSQDLDASIPLVAKPLWKRLLDGKWNVGFMFAELAPARKAEILEYGYHKWVKQNIPVSV